MAIMRFVATILAFVALLAAPAASSCAEAAPDATGPCLHRMLHHPPAGHAGDHGGTPAGKAATCCVAGCVPAATLPAAVFTTASADRVYPEPVERTATAIGIEPVEPPPRA